LNAFPLLEKYFPDPAALAIVREHSLLVAAKALEVAQALDRTDIDLEFIEEAALLHDVGVCRTDSSHIGCTGSEPYIRHGIIGRELLEAEGLFRHALVCERHIGVGLTAEDVRIQKLPLPERDMTPVSLEERIICFADLFFSKRPHTVRREKPVTEVRKGLLRFGAEKAGIFDDWLREFGERIICP